MVSLVNENGAMAGWYTHDPYGRTSINAVEPVVEHLAVGYAGGLRNGTLIKFGKRWYDTNTGRFTQQDSLNFIGDPANGNRYAYAGGDPLNYTDPTGMFGWKTMFDGVSSGVDAGLVVGGVGGLLVGGFASGGIGAFPGMLLGAAEGAVVGGVIGLGYGIYDGWGE